MGEHQAINGLLLLDKALGVSSNRALQQARHLLLAKKAGHTGCLDPLATGVLPLCFGEATKFASYLIDADKWYETTAQLGVTTTTGDSEGEILQKRSVPTLTLTQIEAVLADFKGQLAQIPPMYSALKHQGQPLYKLARAGKTVERKARQIDIFALNLLEFSNTQLRLRVHCSKGTYIRTLVQDIGEALACGAHVTVLRRLAVGEFKLADCVSVSELEHETISARRSHLKPIDSFLTHLPKVVLSQPDSRRMQQGQVIATEHATGLYRLYDQDAHFLGLGHVQTPGQLTAKRLCQPRSLVHRA